MNIKIAISKKDYKSFTCKHAALTEAIFHIFTLITRIGKLDVNNIELKIRGEFIANSLFPLITIELPVHHSLLESLSWKLGPSYVYTGFLSIYSLAKSNNLLFYIEQKNKKIIFILTPYENNPSVTK